jgi:hypothetical protein
MDIDMNLKSKSKILASLVLIVMVIFSYQYCLAKKLDLELVFNATDKTKSGNSPEYLHGNSLLQYCIEAALNYNTNVLASLSDVEKAEYDYKSIIASNLTPTIILSKGFGFQQGSMSMGPQTMTTSSKPTNQSVTISQPILDSSLLAQIPLLDDAKGAAVIQSEIVKNRVALDVTNTFISLVNESFKQDELNRIIESIDQMMVNIPHLSPENKTYMQTFKINISSALQRSKVVFNNSFIDNKWLTGITDKSIFYNLAKDIPVIARDVRQKLKIPREKDNALDYVISNSPALKMARMSSDLAIDGRRLKLLSGLFNAQLDFTPYSEASMSQAGIPISTSDQSIMLNMSVSLNIFTKALTYQSETANIEKFRYLIESQARTIEAEIEKMYEPITGFLDLSLGILKAQSSQLIVLQKTLTPENLIKIKQEEIPSVLGKLQEYARLINEVSDEYTAILSTQAKFKSTAGLLSDLTNGKGNPDFNYDPIGTIIPIP